jgi:superfamily II DNA/RNA helicase
MAPPLHLSHNHHVAYALSFQVFHLNGIKCLLLNGDVPLQERTSVIEKFRSSGVDGPRVLIVSKIALHGFNFPFSHIVVKMVSGILLSSSILLIDLLLGSTLVWFR